MRRAVVAPEARRLAQLQTRREKLTGWLQCVVFWLSFPFFFLLMLTLGNLDNQLQRGAEYTAAETKQVAHVRSCSEYGPISHAGFGYHWSCSVDHQPARGVSESFPKETLSSTFTPADIGKTFPVVRIGKHLRRYHDDNPVTAGLVWVLIPIGFLALLFTMWAKRRLPNWARGGLAGRIGANPAVGTEFVEKLLREGRLEARPYDPGHAPRATTAVEVAGPRGYRIRLARTGLTGKRNGALVWSLRWEQVERVELTAFHRPDDRLGEHPVARVMDVYTIPRAWAERETGFRQHWNAMGIQGGGRFEYFLSQEKALAIKAVVTAYRADRAAGAGR